jgi:ADP-heptose:LPS heptosyltransferase
MKVPLIKLLDRYVGRTAIYLLYPPQLSFCRYPSKVLFIRPGGIGDAILLIPSILQFKSKFTEAHITILAEKRNAAAFELCPDVDTTLCYDHPREFNQALWGRYDVVIDTEQWYRLSAVVARLVRAPVKIGFATNERRRMFIHSVRYELSAYEPDNFSALLEPLTIVCQQGDKEISLSLPNQAITRAKQLLQSLVSDRFVVIFPSASVPEKRWGAGRFRRVVEMLTVLGIGTVVVGGKEDRQQGETIVAGCLALNLAGLTSLSETAAVIQKCSVLLSGDSGVLHIAAGLNIPTVSLFGPSSSLKWAPRGEKHVVVSRHLSCSPCSMFGRTPPCPHGVRCMNEITVDQVVEAAVRLLEPGNLSIRS